MSEYRDFVRLVGYDPFSPEFLGLDREEICFITLNDCYQVRIHQEIMGLLEGFALEDYRPRKSRAKKLAKLVKLFRTACPNRRLWPEEWDSEEFPF